MSKRPSAASGTTEPARGRAKPATSHPCSSKNWPKDGPGLKGRQKRTSGSSGPENNYPADVDPSSMCVARFDEACEKIRKTTERFLEKVDNCAGNVDVFSSDDDDDDDDDDENDMKNAHDRNASILSKVLSPYSQLSLKNDIGRTEHFLLESIKSGASTCLICLSSIKKTEAIWACDECFCVFHLPCIQTWAKDCIQQQKSNQNAEQSSPVWCCPKCRYEYQGKECPTKYLCFCGKSLDPEFDPWLIPHTCGETCDRNLRPFCGHKCLILCHPGPCPPCPKMVHTSCHCGRQKPQARRCSSQSWSCGKQCGKLLGCGQHVCKESCHQGSCSPCPKTSVQPCSCGKEKMSRPCADPTWHCDTKCELPLSCGHHRCDEVCHSGKCLECPRSKERSCPCGKIKCRLPCTQDVPACGDTCAKSLACGIHSCAQRCHAGPCGTCIQMTMKSCRCGMRTKSMPCSKEFLCEVKCKATRDCGRHLCNRKCCDGNCSPCEQLCGRALRCHNHKCNSPCHQGPCYPCPLMAQVTCRCGGTVSSLPCGTEKTIPPPKCSIPCRIPPKCHHESHVPIHRCHFDVCPPCQQICDKRLNNCSHKCTEKCHTNVLTKVEVPQIRAGPWEPKVAPRMEYISYPCPPCLFPVAVACLGKHETRDFPCSESNPRSCGSECGRPLLCSNHTCSMICHTVDKVGDSDNCVQCEFPCSLPRNKGCPHPCLKPCHPAPCSPCRQTIKQRCLCGLNVQFVPCLKWTSTPATSRRRLLSCGNQCPKNIRCGHRCTLTCHDGPCSAADDCQKVVTVKCECKRIKKEVRCSQARSAQFEGIECDAVCLEKLEKERKLKSEAERRQKIEETRKNKEEAERQRQKLEGKRRHKGRNEKWVSETKSSSSSSDKHRSKLRRAAKSMFIGAVCIAALAVVFYAAIAT